MYLLEDGTPVTEEIKTAFKRGLTRAYIKLGNTIISPDNYLINAKYKDEKADPDTGQFIGVTSMRELTIKLYNYENSLELENKEIEYFVGALVGNEYKYINFGKFIVQEVQNEEVNEETTLTALDYMSKFDGEEKYVSHVVFNENTKLLDLLQDVCTQVGVELGNTNFRNANMRYYANPFQNGENCRTVLKSIAKVAFSPAYIGQDNKLYIGFSIEDTIIENITIDDFFENKPNDAVKPITALTLRSSEIKTATQTRYASQEMIDEYGINELIIEEDYLAYTRELRSAYLSGATDLFGLTYKPLTVDLLGSIYLSFNDVIKVTNLQEIEHITYALNNTHEFNGTLYNTISAPSLTEEEEKHKYESEDKTYKKKTAIEIDKANGEIRAIVDESDPNSLYSVTTSLVGRVGELETSVKKYVGITDKKEDVIATVSINDVNESEPIEIQIHPLVQNIRYLYPKATLYPSDTTYLKNRVLRFTNTSVYEQTTDNQYNNYRNYYIYDNQEGKYVLLIEGTDYQVGDTISGIIYQNKEVDYELPCDLYYYDIEHYDEFILNYADYDNRFCIVNKKVGINADGTTYLLNEQTTITYPYPTIPLTRGNYTISILGYDTGYLSVTLMIQNAYTTQYATRVELSSTITQTVNSIDLSVNQKLIGYSTTAQMNSAINLKANEITSSVRETYATKTTVNTLESKIEQKASSITLSITNGSTTAGISISLKDENGHTIDSKSGTIQMTGLVKFTDLSGNGTTTINGNNITTGTISASRLDTSSINATTGSIAGWTITNDSLDSATAGMSNGHYYAFYVKNGNATPYYVTLSGDLACNSLLINGFPTMKTSVESGKQIMTYYVDGNQLITSTANSLYVVLPDSIISDKNMKKEIKSTQINGLKIIEQIDFVQFDWKGNGEHEDIGVITQDVEKINKYLVTDVDLPDGTATKIFNSSRMILVNSKAIQELYKELKELKERIK